MLSIDSITCLYVPLNGVCNCLSEMWKKGRVNKIFRRTVSIFLPGCIDHFAIFKILALGGSL